mmetsp:Transcript_20415/g.47729  ORF Transcript_20415/g.47729 Transcript_20415/m.47729 type:complete len:204 (-) Transcript_20415:449-1060(-)
MEDIIGGTLTLELEHHHTTVVTSSKKVLLWVNSQNPESVLFSAEGLHAAALRHVPHTNRAILRVGNNQLMLGVEHHTRHIVDVPTESVHLPGLAVIHTPELHLAIVRTRHNQGERGMERSPIHTTVVTFKNILHDCVAASEQIGTNRHLLLRIWVHSLLAETGDVPDANSLIKRCRDAEVFLGMEHGRHHVVVVSGQDGDARA